MRSLLTFSLTAVALGVWVGSAQGAMTASINNQNAAWPVGAVIDTGAPQVSPGEPDYDGERDVKDQRLLLQTFQVSQQLDVSDIFVYYKVPNQVVSDSFEVRIYQTADVFNSGTDADNDQTDLSKLTLVDSATVTWDHTAAVSDPGVLHIGVSGLTLPALAGPAGYGIILYNPDTDGILPFKWAGERTIDTYAGGRSYSDSTTSWTSDDDWSLAIIPEPASAVLLLAGAGLLFRRRR